jgi:HPt (histidine-containing phosphotransfer) domain-containing protein
MAHLLSHHDREAIEMAKISYSDKQTYLKRRRGDILRCQNALTSGDLETIERIGHKMKGNAETFGFDPLADIGISLENAAQERDIPTLKNVLNQFGKVLDELSAEAEY